MVVVALQPGVGLTVALSCVSPATSRLVTGRMTHSSACFSSMIRIWPSGFGNRCVINTAREFGGVNMGGQ